MEKDGKEWKRMKRIKRNEKNKNAEILIQTGDNGRQFSSTDIIIFDSKTGYCFETHHQYKGDLYKEKDFDFPRHVQNETAPTELFPQKAIESITNEDLVKLIDYYTRMVLIKAANLRKFSGFMKGHVNSHSILRFLAHANVNKNHVGNKISGKGGKVLGYVIEAVIGNYIEAISHLPWERYFIDIGNTLIGKDANKMSDFNSERMMVEVEVIKQAMVLFLNTNGGVMEVIKSSDH